MLTKIAIIKKLPSGKYRLYSRKKDKSGKRKNLGTFNSLSAAKKHEGQVQFFKAHSDDGMADDHETKTLDRLSNIANYLEEAGYIKAADKIYMVMNAIDGSLNDEDNLIDMFINTDNQMNVGGPRGEPGPYSGSAGDSPSLLSMDAPTIVTADIGINFPEPTEEELNLWNSGNTIEAIKQYRLRVGTNMYDAKAVFMAHSPISAPKQISKKEEELCVYCGKMKDKGEKCWMCGKGFDINVPGQPSKKWPGWYEDINDNGIELNKPFACSMDFIKSRSDPYDMDIGSSFNVKNNSVDCIGKISIWLREEPYNARFSVIPSAKSFSGSWTIFTRKGYGPDKDKLISQVVADAEKWIRANRKRASIINQLVKIANDLDQKGLYEEADILDKIAAGIKKIKPPRPDTDQVYPLKNIEWVKERIEDIPQQISNIDNKLHEFSSKKMNDTEKTHFMYLSRKRLELLKELEEAHKFLKSPVYEWGYDKKMREMEKQEEYEQNPDPIDLMQEEAERKSLGLTKEEYRLKKLKDQEESQKKTDEEVESGFWDEQWKEVRKQQIEDAAKIPNFDPESAVILPDGTVKDFEANDAEVSRAISKLDRIQRMKGTEKVQPKEKPKQDEEAVARSNGHVGTGVTDNQNAGMFSGFSDAYFYRGYGDLEGPYGSTDITK